MPSHLVMGNHDKRESLLDVFPDTPVDANGNPTVDVDVIRRLAKSLDTALQQLDAGAVRKAALWLKRARRSLRKQLPPDIPPLPSFEIEGYQPPEENHGQ